MVKKIIFKDAIREIKNNKSIFIILILIITLASSLYVGLNKTASDMKKTADNYYKKTNLMDLKITSSMGFSKDEIIELKKIKEVKGVFLEKTLISKANIKDKDYVIKVNSINKNRSTKNNDYINRLILTSGRYPSTINEGLVEEKLLKDSKAKIGDLVSLQPDNKNDLRAKKIKIVGTIKSSYYSYDKSSDEILNNYDSNYNIYIEENDFGTAYYTECFITLNNWNNYNMYSKNYDNYVKKSEKEILNLIQKNAKSKYEYKVNDLKDEIKNLEDSLNDLYSSEVPKDLLNESIKQLSDDLSKTKDKLNNISSPNTNIFRKTEIKSFSKYNTEIKRLDELSKVYSTMFLIVLSLVSLSIIMNLIISKKDEINMLKVMGYNNFEIYLKYILYYIGTIIIGNFIGSLISYNIIPSLVFRKYKVFFEMPSLIVTLNIKYIIDSIIFEIVILITFIILLGTIKKLKVFKKINLKFLLKKLSINSKLAVKNILFNKYQIILYFICTILLSSLLLMSFKTNNSINKTVDKEFKIINNYDIKVNINYNLNNETLKKLENKLNKNKSIDNSLKVNESTISLNNKKSTLIISSDIKKLKEFTTLKNTNIYDSGITISSVLAKKLNVKENDKVNIKIDNKTYKVKVSSIFNNYIYDYAYMSEKFYKSLTDNKSNYNTIYIKTKNNIAKEIESYNNHISCDIIKNIDKNYKDSYSPIKNFISNLTVVIIALLIVNIISLTLAIYKMDKNNIISMKMLGYYDKEIISYLFKESLIVIILGTIIGLIIGSLLVINIFNGCMNDFNLFISIISYILIIIISTIISLIITISIYYYKNNQ